MEMLPSPEPFIGGIDFGEGPRWRDGRLWYSDFYQYAVKAASLDGTVEVIVEVPGQPSGLGWMPNGDLLVVSMRDRRVMRYDGVALHEHADLSEIATSLCNDMTVDAEGRAYVGNFGFDLHAGEDFAPAVLGLVQPDGTVEAAADGLAFPNGAVITPDGATYIVGESFASQFTAFDFGPEGRLENRRLWAAVAGHHPRWLLLRRRRRHLVCRCDWPGCPAGGRRRRDHAPSGDRAQLLRRDAWRRRPPHALPRHRAGLASRRGAGPWAGAD